MARNEGWHSARSSCKMNLNIYQCRTRSMHEFVNIIQKSNIIITVSECQSGDGFSIVAGLPDERQHR